MKLSLKNMSIVLALLISINQGVLASNVLDNEKPNVSETYINESNLVEEKDTTLDSSESKSDEEDKKENKKYIVSRIEGKDRYETAINASNMLMNAEIAVIASGENFADALFGGPLASQVNGPMLLTSKDSLPNGLLEKLKELKVKTIYLLGGENSISKDIEDVLTKNGYGTIRLSGDDRFDTASKINYTAGLLRGSRVLGDTTCLFANPFKFADALTAAPLGYLMEQNGIASRFFPYDANSNNVRDIDIVVGGQDSIPKGEEKERIEGKDRFETAIKIAERYKEILENKKEIKLSRLILVNALNYPDALAAAPIATSENAVILLTNPNKLNEDVKKFILNNDIEVVTILGGESSISKEVEEEVKSIKPLSFEATK